VEGGVRLAVLRLIAAAAGAAARQHACVSACATKRRALQSPRSAETECGTHRPI
jgi:hypothetical protein